MTQEKAHATAKISGSKVAAVALDKNIGSRHMADVSQLLKFAGAGARVQVDPIGILEAEMLKIPALVQVDPSPRA